MVGNYDQSFYEDSRAASTRSAAVVMPIISQALKLSSVCDVGCGVGAWLAEARRCGASTTVGVDGEWLRIDPLANPDLDIRAVDLEKPLNLGRRFDLAICVEVAEHLSEARAPGLVKDLCALADHVLFSAAIPGQGGEFHINEQWQSYWRDLFKAAGYTAIDAIRPVTWDNPNVSWWYSENAFLYVRDELVDEVRARLGDAGGLPTDSVHPVLYARPPSLGFRAVVRAFPHAFGAAIHRRLRGSRPSNAIPPDSRRHRSRRTTG
jgi:SAM-dependent methyltransferase